MEPKPFGLERMQEIQSELQSKYLERWGGLSPEKGVNQLLWMMIEAGEMADVMKKEGVEAIVENRRSGRISWRKCAMC